MQKLLKKTATALLTLIVFSSCKDKSISTGTAHDINKHSAVVSGDTVVYDVSDKEGGDIDSDLQARLGWTDALVDDYTKRSSNPLIRAWLKSGKNEQWLWDRIETSDTTHYIVFHLGHDQEDHFATDGWLYIDTSTRQIYEYDAANDSLIKWP